ncbi:CobD/CbiB family protein [Chitinibacteraceae bacterium HSL-7]
MIILSLILALLLEQLRPISNRNRFYLAFVRYANTLERALDAGEYRDGVYGWFIAVAPLALIAWGGYALLSSLHEALGFAWNVGILYLTMGFRQFSSAFSGISRALQADDLPTARRWLAAWTREPAGELTHDEVSRVAVEQGLIDSYRYVFGTIFWFAILAPFAGPLGAALYRGATLVDEKWRTNLEESPFGRFARTVQEWLDYVPVRLTATAFAVMGDFEDSVYCWRSQASAWKDYAHGILLAAGAGAIGIRLGEALHQDHTLHYRPELGIGNQVTPDTLASAVGLIWRSVLLWLAFILLVNLAYWAG